MTEFKIGDAVRAPTEKHHRGTVKAVNGNEIEVQWHGIAASVRLPIVRPEWIEHIPLPMSVMEAERAIVRAAMEWFAAEDAGYELDRLVEVCSELREALRRQGGHE